MKTITTLILPAILVLLISNATIAGNETSYPFYYKTTSVNTDTSGMGLMPIYPIIPEDEAYVDDIPFNTREIIAGSFVAAYPVEDPEPYVNDIPFRTESIASRFLPARITGIFPEAESYINDIPFNTKKIAEKYCSNDQGRFCYILN